MSATPRFISEAKNDALLMPESEAGFAAMGMKQKGKQPTPQQLLLTGVLNSCNDQGFPLYPFCGILLPRRSGKTTSLIALAIGRCLSRSDYLVGVTFATTGAKVAQRFRADVFPVLERMYPDEDTRPFRILRSNGHEQIEFDNGSRLLVLGPNPDAFRSESFDLIIIDEAGEATPALGEDLLSGALPTMDTRPHAAIWISGTAGKYRKGNLLWDTLVEGREGVAGTGIIEYSAADHLTADDTETWEQVKPLVLAAHPGIGTLTTVEAIERNFRKLPREQFMREYLGRFGDAGHNTGLITPQEWDKCKLDADLPVPPNHFSLAISTMPNGAYGSICAAWREDGQARILTLKHREGTKWLAAEAAELSRKYKVPIVHDSRGVILLETETLNRMTPRPRMEPQKDSAVYTAAGLLLREVQTGNLRHWGQDSMTKAALTVVRRNIGPKAWAFGRSKPDDDITEMEAASMALYHYDQKPPRKALPRMTVTS